MKVPSYYYMVLATDFELEPIIEQYLKTYPDVKPSKYEVLYKIQNERQDGDFCYILLWEGPRQRDQYQLAEYIKAYCELNDKVANIEVGGTSFPDLARGKLGNAARYQKP